MSIACKNLAVSQTVGHQPPDPFAALYVADSRGHWERVSRTETAQNTRGQTRCASCTFLARAAPMQSAWSVAIHNLQGNLADHYPISCIGSMVTAMLTALWRLCRS